MIEIVVMNHAVSFAGLAPERARPNVSDGIFLAGLRRQSAQRSQCFFIGTNYQTCRYKCRLEQMAAFLSIFGKDWRAPSATHAEANRALGVAANDAYSIDSDLATKASGRYEFLLCGA